MKTSTSFIECVFSMEQDGDDDEPRIDRTHLSWASSKHVMGNSYLRTINIERDKEIFKRGEVYVD